MITIGKTTLSDYLVSSNGLIGPSAAGQTRYLDSREDEQMRFITMKSSCITLSFTTTNSSAIPSLGEKLICHEGRRLKSQALPPDHHEHRNEKDNYNENSVTNAVSVRDIEKEFRVSESEFLKLNKRSQRVVVDAPFSIESDEINAVADEVTSAARLCDGGLLLVDAVEGVCPQTRQVMHQAFTEKLKLLLVMNKVDRLFTELRMSAAEAYSHLKKIIQDVNVAAQQLVVEKAIKQQNDSAAYKQSDAAAAYTPSDGAPFTDSLIESNTEGGDHSFSIDDSDEQAYFFSPELQNVVFCSALHGWCFGLRAFSRSIVAKLKLPSSAVFKLEKTLWGEYYFNPKTKAVSAKPFTASQSPMAVQMVLEQVRKVYVAAEESSAAVLSIGAALGLSPPVTGPKRTLKSNITGDPYVALKCVMSGWFPLSDNLLVGYQNYLMQAEYFTEVAQKCVLYDWDPVLDSSKQIYGPILQNSVVDVLPTPMESLQSRLNELMVHPPHSPVCHPDSGKDEGSFVLVFCAKFLSADLKSLRLTGDKLSGTEKPGSFVVIARVFSGIIRKNDVLYVSGTEFLQERNLLGTNVGSPCSQILKQRAVAIHRIFYFVGQDLAETTIAYPGMVMGFEFTKVPTRQSDKTQSGESVLKGATAPSQIEIEPAEADCDDVDEWVKALLDKDRNQSKLLDDSWDEAPVRDPANTLCSLDRSITLSNDPQCPPFKTPFSHANRTAIVRVAILPVNLKETSILFRGLAMLYKADPGVEVDVLPSGEIALGCCGAVHLEKCLTDLHNVYARIPLKVSPPLVALRETLVPNSREFVSAVNGPLLPWLAASNIPDLPTMEQSEPCLTGDQPTQNSSTETVLYSEIASSLKANRSNHKIPSAIAVLPMSSAGFSVRAEPLPPQVTEWLETNAVRLATAGKTDISVVKDEFRRLWRPDVSRQNQSMLQLRPGNIVQHRKECPGTLLGVCVSRGARTCLFLDKPDENLAVELERSGLFPPILMGFRLASYAGPVAEEPVVGVAFVIDAVLIAPHMIAGHAISCIREACRTAMTLRRGCLRIYEAILRLQVYCEAEVLGRSCGALAKRRGHILSETLRDGTSNFLLEAHVPVAESFNLAAELRGKASGKISVQMQFSHYELNEEDPFPEASMTDEELEDEGENFASALNANVTRKLILSIRKRKGLPTDEKVVAEAEKQRTLSRKK